MQRLLDHLTDTPAFVLGKYLDLLAFNPSAAALLADVERIPVPERNIVRMIVVDPRMEELYDDWEGLARTSVALLRMQALDNPTDPRLAALVGELSVRLPVGRGPGQQLVMWTAEPGSPPTTRSGSSAPGSGPRHPGRADRKPDP